MKNLLFIIALFAFKIASAEIVVKHNPSGGYYYCDITPYLCDNCGEDTAKQLAITTVSNNEVDRAEIYWVIYTDAGSNAWSGNLQLQGADYRNYRDVDCSTDSFAKAKFLYNFVHTKKAAIEPIE